MDRKRARVVSRTFYGYDPQLPTLKGDWRLNPGTGLGVSWHASQPVRNTWSDWGRVDKEVFDFSRSAVASMDDGFICDATSGKLEVMSLNRGSDATQMQTVQNVVTSDMQPAVLTQVPRAKALLDDISKAMRHSGGMKPSVAEKPLWENFYQVMGLEACTNSHKSVRADSGRIEPTGFRPFVAVAVTQPAAVDGVTGLGHSSSQMETDSDISHPKPDASSIANYEALSYVGSRTLSPMEVAPGIGMGHASPPLLRSRSQSDLSIASSVLIPRAIEPYPKTGASGTPRSLYAAESTFTSVVRQSNVSPSYFPESLKSPNHLDYLMQDGTMSQDGPFVEAAVSVPADAVVLPGRRSLSRDKFRMAQVIPEPYMFKGSTTMPATAVQPSEPEPVLSAAAVPSHDVSAARSSRDRYHTRGTKSEGNLARGASASGGDAPQQRQQLPPPPARYRFTPFVRPAMTLRPSEHAEDAPPPSRSVSISRIKALSEAQMAYDAACEKKRLGHDLTANERRIISHHRARVAKRDSRALEEVYIDSLRLYSRILGTAVRAFDGGHADLYKAALSEGGVVMLRVILGLAPERAAELAAISQALPASSMAATELLRAVKSALSQVDNLDTERAATEAFSFSLTPIFDKELPPDQLPESPAPLPPLPLVERLCGLLRIWGPFRQRLPDITNRILLQNTFITPVRAVVEGVGVALRDASRDLSYLTMQDESLALLSGAGPLSTELSDFLSLTSNQKSALADLSVKFAPAPGLSTLVTAAKTLDIELKNLRRHHAAASDAAAPVVIPSSSNASDSNGATVMTYFSEMSLRVPAISAVSLSSSHSVKDSLITWLASQPLVTVPGPPTLPIEAFPSKDRLTQGEVAAANVVLSRMRANNGAPQSALRAYHRRYAHPGLIFDVGGYSVSDNNARNDVGIDLDDSTFSAGKK